MQTGAKNRHKTVRTPLKREFTGPFGTSRNGIFPLVGTGGPAPCRSGVPRPMIFYGRVLNVHISFNVNKRRARLTTAKARDTSLFLIMLITDILGFPSASLR